MTKKIKDINGLSYEQAQQELQELLGQIEAQSIPLDALLAAYQRCQELLAHCRSKLGALEAQIQHIDSGSSMERQPSAPAPKPAQELDDDIPF
jgi:exodeoxyribonuclease VII small subunit